MKIRTTSPASLNLRSPDEPPEEGLGVRGAAEAVRKRRARSAAPVSATWRGPAAQPFLGGGRRVSTRAMNWVLRISPRSGPSFWPRTRYVPGGQITCEASGPSRPCRPAFGLHGAWNSRFRPGGLDSPTKCEARNVLHEWRNPPVHPGNPAPRTGPPGWHAEAWLAVAPRSPGHREPGCPSRCRALLSPAWTGRAAQRACRQNMLSLGTSVLMPADWYQVYAEFIISCVRTSVVLAEAAVPVQL